MHRTVGVALVAALALGVASCGGSEVKLTQAQMVARLDAICTEARTATEHALKASARSAQAPRTRLLDAFVAGQHLLIDRLGGVNPPDAAKQDLDAFKQGFKQRLALIEHLRATGAATPTAAVQRQQQAIFERLDVIAHRYRLSGCV